jgi:glycosyltransferase involved in cell wall biosynthesis
VISDPKLRASLAADGLRRAKSFSWEKSAEGLLAVFEELAS